MTGAFRVVVDERWGSVGRDGEYRLSEHPDHKAGDRTFALCRVDHTCVAVFLDGARLSEAERVEVSALRPEWIDEVAHLIAVHREKEHARVRILADNRTPFAITALATAAALFNDGRIEFIPDEYWVSDGVGLIRCRLDFDDDDSWRGRILGG